MPTLYAIITTLVSDDGYSKAVVVAAMDEKVGADETEEARYGPLLFRNRNTLYAAAGDAKQVNVLCRPPGMHMHLYRGPKARAACKPL